MATVTKPIALDESINTTENPSRNIADVLAEELKGIADNILPPNASQIAYDNTASGLTATNVQDAIDEVISSQADVIADTMADLTENKTATVTDGVADFETIDGSLVKSLVVEIEPSQSGSGTPSPSNIRPITGWTQEDTEVIGYADDVSAYTGDGYINNAFLNEDGTTTSNNGYAVSGYIPFSFAMYYLNLNQGFNNPSIGFYDSSKNLISARKYGGNREIKATTPNRTAFVRVSYQKSLSATLSQYEVYTTPFNQTVYGGTLDVLSGELTVTHGYVDLGSLTWNQASTSTSGKNRFTASITPSPKPSPSNTSVPDLTCSHYETVSPSNTYNCIDGITVTTTGVIAIYDDTLATVSASDFKTAMNGVQLVYELATPTTLSLTPQTVKSLVGENHIQASTGDVTECKFSMLINGDDLEILLS